MALCINKNSVQYQSLKNRAGIPEFILEAVSRDFMEKYGRLPHLDELPNSNSEPYLRDQLGVTKQNSAKVESILEMTGKETVEEAVIDINNQFRDLETTIVPINKEALVDIVHRPTDNNFDNWTEEDQILAEAPRDNNGNLLAPNGKVSNLTEKQYIQVRTKAFKRWFGDWEKVAPSTEASNRLINYINDISNRNNRFSKLAKLLLDNRAIPYNLKYFKIDNNRDDIEGYSAMWHSLANLIEVLGNNVSQESIDKAILHELIHYNTEQLLQDYKNNKEIPATQKEAIRRLYDIIEYSKNYLSKELQTNRDKYLEIAKRQSNTVNSRLFYAFDNTGSVEIDEFISEIFTNPGLQEVLNNIPYKESKQSLWDKIKEAISS